MESKFKFQIINRDVTLWALEMEVCHFPLMDPITDLTSKDYAETTIIEFQGAVVGPKTSTTMVTMVDMEVRVEVMAITTMGNTTITTTSHT